MTPGPMTLIGPQRSAANYCSRGSFEHFQTVEGVQDRTARHQDAVSFQEHHRAFWVHNRRHFCALSKLVFKGDLANVF